MSNYNKIYNEPNSIEMENFNSTTLLVQNVELQDNQNKKLNCKKNILRYIYKHIKNILIVILLIMLIIVIYHFSAQIAELMKLLLVLFNIKNNTLYLNNNTFQKFNNTILQYDYPIDNNTFQKFNNTILQYDYPIDNNTFQKFNNTI